MEINNTSSTDTEYNELVMFYNVENFYIPDSQSSENPNLPASGLKNWDEKKYKNKLFKIAHVFELIKEEYEVLPMIVGLSEIQGEKVISEFLKMDVFENNFGFVHYESMDERGVDVALLYDKTKIEIESSDTISYFFEINDQDPENYDTTRDILHVKAKFKGEIIHVFVFHLPSKRENDINKPKRDYILKDIKEKLETLVKQGEAILLLGDFNENPNEENLKKILYNDDFRMILTNPFIELYENNTYSTYHYNYGLVFDQIILSNEFFVENFPLNYLEAKIFSHPKISNWDKKFIGRPFRTYAGTRYLGGYSDHFPVLVKFNKK